jgi:DNA-directed RNA polymerase subunit L
MEINILKEEKNSLKIEIKGEDHTLANALRRELWNGAHVKIAGYSIDHPLVGSPILIVETEGKEDAKKTLLSCVDRLKKKNSDFLSKIKSF